MSRAIEKAKFWHQPRGDKSTWHAYRADGQSVCGLFALIGIGIPKDAKTSVPRSGKCTRCVAKLMLTQEKR
jgi:hypothetical protein